MARLRKSDDELTSYQWYRRQLQDPRWKAKRLIILERDGHKCRLCGDTERLQVHHTYYQGDPWDVPDRSLFTVCNSCHFKVEGGMEFSLPPETGEELVDDVIRAIRETMNVLGSKLKKYEGIVQVTFQRNRQYKVQIRKEHAEKYLRKIKEEFDNKASKIEAKQE